MGMRIDVIISVFCCCISLFTHARSATVRNEHGDDLDPFTFDDIFDDGFQRRSFSARWISATQFLYRDVDSGDIMQFNAATKTASIFVDSSTFTSLNSYTWYVSNDLLFVLFAYDRTKLWRHSFNAKYAVLDVTTNDLTYIPQGALQNSTLQYAMWSPTGNSLSFVYGNNLYYQSSPTDQPVQLTTTGDPLYVFNGVPDWLYEEDVLSERMTHYWSPDSRCICYASINDTGVPLQEWPWYGDKSDVYGQMMRIAYPKAGDVRNGQPGPNARATLYVYNTLTSSTIQLPPPNNYKTVDHYYVQVAWRDEETVMVTWTNRVQTESISMIYNVTEDPPMMMENLKLTETGGWIQVEPATPWFTNDGSKYFTVLPRAFGNTGNWRHLAVVTSSMNAVGLISHLTNGQLEVQRVVGLDTNRNFVYYESTNGDPAERHILRVNYSSTGATPECLTCNMPDSCRYMSSNFAPDPASWFLLNCHGPDIPVYYLRNVDDPGDEYVLENNDILKTNLAKKALPTREFLTFPIGGGYTGRAEMFYPPGHQDGFKYPLLVYAYAGPGSQRVMKTFPVGSWTNNWLTYLKSTHHIAIASLDGRGSAAAGDKLKFEMYRRPGTIEVEDQITGGQYFAGMEHIDDTLPLGMFGWSYGGSVAAHALGEGSFSGTFKCGVSVAPSTTDAFYDTAYTERYLGLATPTDNEAGYNATDIMNKAKNFQGKKFFLAHGIADDNVHFMHTTHLIRALTEAGIQFRQSIYVDEAHSVLTPSQRRHLFAAMTDFLLNDCWPDRPMNPISDGQRLKPASASVAMTTLLGVAVASAMRVVL